MIDFQSEEVNLPSTRPYRPEIDGLRTVAVVPVVLFHAGIGLFAGGFVGVDIFFVISGYLITSILAAEGLASGRVSITGFYRRRVRRIAPALLVVLAASTIVGYILLLPYQYVEFAKSLLATLLFASNIWFWLQTGYFSAQDGIQPLLHTWSLAIEEQFYIFAPVVIGIFAGRSHALKVIFVLATVASFAISIPALARSPSATFYWLPTRAWELLIGSLLALDVVPAVRIRRQAEVVAWAGIACILAAIFFMREDMPFPGALAMLPCLGAAMVIHANTFSPTFVGRILATRPMVVVGLISYSLYLWHWPIIIYLRQFTMGELSPQTMVLSIGLSFALAALTYRFVEQPTRSGWHIRPLVVASGAVAVMLASACAIIINGVGLPNRFQPDVIRLAAAANDHVDLCPENADHCIPGAPPSVAVIGDSHAASLAEAIDAAGVPLLVSSFNACPPIQWDVPRATNADEVECRKRNSQGMSVILRDEHIRAVILVANWRAYTGMDQRAVDAALRRRVAAITASGRQAVIVSGVPYADVDLPWASALAAMRGGQPPVVHRSAVIRVNGADTIDVGDAFCTRAVCPSMSAGAPILRDGNHLTRTVARDKLGPWLARHPVLRDYQKPNASSHDITR